MKFLTLLIGLMSFTMIFGQDVIAVDKQPNDVEQKVDLRLNAAGAELEKAGNFILGSYALAAVGSIASILAATSNSPAFSGNNRQAFNILVFGCSVGSLVLHLSGVNRIRKAGMKMKSF